VERDAHQHNTWGSAISRWGRRSILVVTPDAGPSGFCAKPVSDSYQKKIHQIALRSKRPHTSLALSGGTR
jgi:hypothetical protein